MKFYLYLLIFSLFLFSLVSVGQDLIPFQQSESGLWGYRNQKTGEVVIDPKFEQVGEFSNGKVWVKNSDGSFLIDEKGKISVSLIYEGVGSFSKGLGGAKQDDKWGFINKKGVSPFPLPTFQSLVNSTHKCKRTCSWCFKGLILISS